MGTFNVQPGKTVDFPKGVASADVDAWDASGKHDLDIIVWWSDNKHEGKKGRQILTFPRRGAGITLSKITNSSSVVVSVFDQP